jgi:arylsulfatase A-like enzyme
MSDRPNILFIMTDQQSRHMMSCAGNKYLNTPAMDSMAEAGTRFTRAYCANPVCVPSRFSLFTGRMPSEIKLQNNGPVGVPEIPDEIMTTGLGWTLKNGGYSAVYAGKQHLPKMTAEDLGFDVLTQDERDELATITAEFVTQPHDKPWCLVASFINPHDICYMAIRDHAEGKTQKNIMNHGSVPLGEVDKALESAEGISEDEFFEKHCPPLPPNHEPQDGEPEALRDLLERRAFRKNARENWDEQRWRMHRWAYDKLTERVDGQIQILLDALKSGPAGDDTIVIFTSDHGDHDSSHQMEHKTAPYEEAAGIPLIICEPGAPAGTVNDTDLISNGLDLYPTVCDYAGIDIPPHIEGVSLRPLVEGRQLDEPRQAIRIETEIGNAIVTDRYKYLKCFDGDRAEQFYHRENDPHEARNAANDPDQKDALDLCRRYYSECFPSNSEQ